MRGWVYVISNAAMPGLVKVGFSMQDPALRAQELGHTGTPHSYEVDYDVLVDGPEEAERLVHAALVEHREGKEWFRCSVELAAAAIDQVIGDGKLAERWTRCRRPFVSTWVCQQCRHVVPRWLGQCPECDRWGTIVEGASPSDSAPTRVQNSRIDPGSERSTMRAPRG